MDLISGILDLVIVQIEVSIFFLSQDIFMSYKILTHSGKAHIDEVIGSALLALHLNEEPEMVERINSQDVARMVENGEIPENTYVIDTGLVFDRKRRLFDHHQDGKLPSAALLIFNEFFPHLEGTELHHFIKLVSRVDTLDLTNLNDYSSVSESNDYWSFTHKILVRTFEENPMLVLKIMIGGIKDKIEFEQVKKLASIWRKEPGNIEIISVESVNILIYLKKPPSELTSALKSEMNSLMEKNEISVTISFDDKNPEVRTLYRTQIGQNNVDFTRCHPVNTFFNHPGGFLLKFIPTEDNEWVKLVKEALIPKAGISNNQLLEKKH